MRARLAAPILRGLLLILPALSPSFHSFVRVTRPQRARATRQDLILAASEVETANALCDKWRAEEDAAARENARLQVHTFMRRKVQVRIAISRHQKFGLRYIFMDSPNEYFEMFVFLFRSY